MSEKTKPTDDVQEEELDDQQEEMTREQKNQTEQIVETGAITTTKGKYVIHCLTIVGQVEGHYILPPQNKTTKYEHVIPQLVAIQENPEIEGLIIILNTVGGDVEAGLAIAELVSGMKKPTVSLVLGGGHSIGVPLAVSARKSFIVPSATMTIHPVRMNGVVLGVPQTLSYFDKMQERIVRFVEENSNISAKQFRHLMMNTGELVMDVGTVLDGQQAVEKGLIDNLGGLSDAINCLYDLIEAERENTESEGVPEEATAERKSEAKQNPTKTGVYRPVREAGRDHPPFERKHLGRRRRHMPAYAGLTQQLAQNRIVRQAARAAVSGHTVETGTHTIYRSRDNGGQDFSTAFSGGGEHSRVNPFGHPGLDADPEQ